LKSITKEEKMFAKKMIRLILAIGSLMLVAATPTTSSSSHTQIERTEVEQRVYHDSRFDFSLKYPTSYTIEPRDDKIAGSVLTFRQSYSHSSDETQAVTARFVVGMYFVEWTGKETIAEWTEKYYDLVGIERRSDRNESINNQLVDGIQSLKVIDQSQRAAYRYVNVPRGNVVWFIWGNSAVDATTFDNVIISFQFGANTPQTLQEIYGQSFRPLSIDRDRGRQEELLVTPGYLRVPLSGSASCNSPAHTGASQFAVDVSTPVGTAIYASQTGSVFYGWYPTTWGNLLILTTEPWAGSYKVYYAHLSGYDEATLHSGPPFFYAYKDERIGWTGNTGNSTGPHLHLEVRNSAGNGMTLVGMSGFSATTSYPTGTNCGTLTR